MSNYFWPLPKFDDPVKQYVTIWSLGKDITANIFIIYKAVETSKFFDRYIIFGLKSNHVLDQLLFYGFEIGQSWLTNSVKMTI